MKGQKREGLEGGFCGVRLVELTLLWWLFAKERTLSNLAVRLWAGARELREQREVYRRGIEARGEALPESYRAEFLREEFSSMVGESRRLKGAFRELRAAGVMEASKSRVDFERDPKKAQLQDERAFWRFFYSLRELRGERSELVAVPRRVLRWLAKYGSKGRFAAVFAVIAATSSYQKGELTLEGTVKLERMASLFGVSVRGLRNSFRELEALGWIRTEQTRRGLELEVNRSWEAPLENRPPVAYEIAGQVHEIAGQKPRNVDEIAGQTFSYRNSPSEKETRELRRKPPQAAESGFSRPVTGESRPRLRVVDGGKGKSQSLRVSQASDGEASRTRSSPSPLPAAECGSRVAARTRREVLRGGAGRALSEAMVPPEARGRAPTLRNLVADDLDPKRLPRLEVLYREGVELGWWSESEHAWRELVCASVHARRVASADNLEKPEGGDPVRHFAWLIRGRVAAERAALERGLCPGRAEFVDAVEAEVRLRCRNVTDRDDDEAQGLLKDYAAWKERVQGGAPRAWWVSHLMGGGEEALSEDARFLRALLRRGRSHPEAALERALAQREPSWTRERWQAAKAEILEKNWGVERESVPSSAKRSVERSVEFILDNEASKELLFGRSGSDEKRSAEALDPKLRLVANA